MEFRKILFKKLMHTNLSKTVDNFALKYLFIYEKLQFSSEYILAAPYMAPVTYPNKKVDHEENVEGKIDLLGGTIRPFLARLHRLSVTAHEFTTSSHCVQSHSL